MLVIMRNMELELLTCYILFLFLVAHVHHIHMHNAVPKVICIQGKISGIKESRLERNISWVILLMSFYSFS